MTAEPLHPLTRPPARARPYARVTVWRTQQKGGDRLQRVGVFRLGTDASSGGQAPSVFVCPRREVSKPWMGWGGSFSEASAVTLNKLSANKQTEVLQAYFHPTTGLGYTLGRVPIGSCDFSTGTWSCGEPFYENGKLRGFSIARYHEAILPMINRATAIATSHVATSQLTLLASPWTPVPSMKTIERFNGGTLRQDCRMAWALHYVQFIEEMHRAGVQIWGVSVQNEPETAQPWESCVWTAEDERDFVRDYLGPVFHKNGLSDVKILVWDHNRDGMLERAAKIYDDPQAARYIWGLAYHWYGDARFEVWPDMAKVCFSIPQENDSPVLEVRAQACFENVKRVAELRPDKHILFTEGCQELSGLELGSKLGHWKYAERYAMNIIADINAGCEGWIDWNLCLDDKGGPNHCRNYCLAPIIVDSVANRVLYQPCFWYLSHFAKHIRPGARRVVCGTSRDVLEVTAFNNAGGDGGDNLALVVLNQSSSDVNFWLKVLNDGGVSAVRLFSPARSILTLVVDHFTQGIDSDAAYDEGQQVAWRKSAVQMESDHSRAQAQEAERRRAANEESAARRRSSAKELAREAQRSAALVEMAPPRLELEQLGRVWLVVGGGGTAGGIIVRTGEHMRSSLYPERLATGSRVEQVVVRGNRLSYRRLTGRGPEYGWVSLRHHEKHLVEPEDSDDDFLQTYDT